MLHVPAMPAMGVGHSTGLAPLPGQGHSRNPSNAFLRKEVTWHGACWHPRWQPGLVSLGRSAAHLRRWHGARSTAPRAAAQGQAAG